MDTILQSLDKETLEKCIGVRTLAFNYAKQRKIDSKEAKMLIQAATYIDVGKINISSKILQKTEPLTDSEKEVVRLHPYFGYQICKENGVEDAVAELVLYHHGRFPPHVKEIPPLKEHLQPFAKALFTFDVYHALTTDREYRQAYEHEEAIEIMEREKDKYSESVMQSLTGCM